MLQIPYDSSRDALLHPERQPTVFGTGGLTLSNLNAVCAECARLAYVHFESEDATQHQQLIQALAAVGLGEWHGVNDTDTGTQAYAVCAANGGPALIAFRGTEPDAATDIGRDLDASLDVWPRGGRAHAGFAQGFAAVRDRLQSWLDTHGIGRPLVVTGHSLGAALATLAASQWPHASLITFGAPRVGDEAFVRTIKLQTAKRFVDCCDIVTQVPPVLPGLYADTGPMSYIDRFGQIRDGIAARDIEVDRAIARAEYLLRHTWFTGSVWARDLADHAPINYLRALLD